MPMLCQFVCTFGKIADVHTTDAGQLVVTGNMHQTLPTHHKPVLVYKINVDIFAAGHPAAPAHGVPVFAALLIVASQHLPDIFIA